MMDGNHGMEAETYDPDGTVAQAGGIAPYVEANAQNPLIFDNAPAAGSDNPVKSDGIYTALGRKQDDLTSVPVVSSLLETDYLFLERNGTVYKIRASAVIIPSGSGEGIETESGDALFTEDGQELLIDTGDEEPGVVTTESGEHLLTEGNEAITIE